MNKLCSHLEDANSTIPAFQASVEINSFSSLCFLVASTLLLPPQDSWEKVKFQYSFMTYNCKKFRAILPSLHKAFTHQEAQLSCFQISLEKFEMLKWQTNVQCKDPKGRYYAL